VNSLRHETTLALALAALASGVATASAGAQTDYFNLDAGRPLAIEDAYPIERRALEIQAAPLLIERLGPGIYRGEVEPQIAYGIWRGTQVELGVPMAFGEGADRPMRVRVEGVELSLLHNLNAETSIPAFAVEASALLPVGDHFLKRPVFSAKGIATRSFARLRMHVNAEYTFGDEDVIRSEPNDPDLAPHLSRWRAGVAFDHAIPLRSTLLGIEAVAEQPLHGSDELSWSFAGGWRWQFTPRIALDGGIGRRVTGSAQGWYVTTGSAFAVGMPWWPR
jgi:hypothetical protein